MKKYAFSIVLLQEGEWWSAQCLEYDIATQARALTDVLYEIQKLIVSHFAVAEAEGRQPFEGVGPAPQKYWELFDRAQVTVTRKTVPFRVSDGSPRIPKPLIRVAELAAKHA